MSQGSDKQNSSDDIIAELARLMASDAKGTPEVSEEKAAPTVSQPVETPAAPQAGYQEDPPIVANPADFDPKPAPAQSVFAPAPPPEPAQTPDEAEFAADQATPSSPFAPHNQAAPETYAPVQETNFAPVTPERDSFSEPPVAASEMVAKEGEQAKDAFDFELPPLRPIDDATFATDQDAPAPYTAQRSFETPAEPETIAFEQEVATTSDYSAPQPASAPATANEMDPIAALIAAQLQEADRVQPGMASTPTQRPLRNSEPETQPFRRTSSFDLESEPAPEPLPRSARDPLDDIESLIGAALRNEGAQSHTPAPSAPESFVAPVQPELPTTRPQPVAPDNSAAMSAEAAILAATSSMRSSPPEADTQPFVASREEGVEKKSGSRPAIPPLKMPAVNLQKIAGPLVAAALLVAVGLGVYWIFGTGGQSEGEAPVLSADTGPVKQAPDATVSDTTPSVVFSEGGNSGQPDTIERLISRDETTDAAGNEVTRVISPNTNSESGLANRKVRTVTVRPDGTIVSGGSAVAGGEQLPVERPNVPTIPGSAIETASSNQLTQPSTAAPANSGVVAPIPLPRLEGRATAPTRVPVAAPSAASSSSNSNAVDLIANSARQAVSAPVTPAPAAVAVSSGSNAPAYVQLSSQRNQEAAQQSLNRVSGRYAAQLGNNTLEIQQVDLGERGVFYRVRMPAQSLEAANNVCANIKASGGDCFVRSN